jgi:muconolactone delta-isomerase
MEYLVEFELHIPDGTPESDVTSRFAAEATAAANLAKQGHLIRLWKTPDESRALGLFQTDHRAELGALLADLPLAVWLHITVTDLGPHPNDPGPSWEKARP